MRIIRINRILGRVDGIVIKCDCGITMSHPSRYPNWEEIKAARYELIPDDIFMVQVLGSPKSWTNVHKNCFHLWEIRDEWLIQVMKQER